MVVLVERVCLVGDDTPIYNTHGLVRETQSIGGVRGDIEI